MVNSCNSRSPILLDTPERASGGNTVIEIPDSGDRNYTRRRRLETVDDMIDSPKRARMDVPVIDLTVDNEEESSTADINPERLIFSVHNSPRYAELRARLFPDDTRLRIRRALRHRPTSLHPRSSRHQVEERHNDSSSSQADNVLPNVRLVGDDFGNVDNNSTPPCILVDDADVSGAQPNHLDLTSEYSRLSCSRIRSPIVQTSDITRPSLLPTSRSERNRISTNNDPLVDSLDSSEIERRSNRRDIPQHARAVRRNQRRHRQLRERLAYNSPFTNYSTNSEENVTRTVQPDETETTALNHHELLPSPFGESVPQRLISRTPPAFPLERPYDIPDLLLPAVLWWGPDSRLRHFGDPDDEHEDYEALWSLTERLGQAKPKGLSKDDMDEIPAFRYSAASKDSSNGSCVVCMMNYSNREKLRRLPCSHDFHAKCIDRWLKSNRSCPVCRKDVTSK